MPEAQPCSQPTTTGAACDNRTTHPSGRCHAHRHTTLEPELSKKDHARAQVGYSTPPAMRAALNERAKQAARDDPTYNVSQRIRQHCYVQFLDRLFDHEPDRWMVKGGGALLARLPGARHTRDIDLWSEGDTVEDGIQAIHETLDAANAEGRPDHLTYEVGEWHRGERHGRPTARTKITARIGSVKVTEFGIDMVAGDPGDHPAEVVHAPVPVPLPGIHRHPWRVYPAVAHTADKVAACFEDYNGQPSSRYRDLSDLAHLSWEETFDADQLRTALHREFARRGIKNPARFVVPDEARWRQGWQSPKNRARPLTGVPFDQAVDRVSSFLDPVLDGTARGRWDPDAGVWR